MTRHDADTLTIRPSRERPGKYVIAWASTGHAVQHPDARLTDTPHEWSFFDTPEAAMAAIGEWLIKADATASDRGPKLTATRPITKQPTLADELDALRSYMAKRDVDPWHGWHPDTKTSRAAEWKWSAQLPHNKRLRERR